MKNNYTKTVNNGLTFVNVNGYNVLYSTFKQITTVHDDGDEYISYNAYIENKIWRLALLCAVSVIKNIRNKTATTFYYDLLNDAYICYAFDRASATICERIEELKRSLAVIQRAYRNNYDERLHTMAKRISDLIVALENYRINGNGNGNGHDLIMSAYIAIYERIKKYGVWFDGKTERHDGDGDGNDETLLKTGARAVNAYIYALKKGFDAIANNDGNDGNGDGDDIKPTAIEMHAYIENFDFDTLDEFYKKYNISDSFQKAICEQIVNGKSITDIAKYFKVSRRTIYVYLAKIKYIMAATLEGYGDSII